MQFVQMLEKIETITERTRIHAAHSTTQQLHAYMYLEDELNELKFTF